MKTVAIAALVLGAVLSSPASSRAQEDMPPEVRARGRRLQAEAMAHVEAERWALAAEAFRQTYELGREYNVRMAPIGLWNVGLALMRIPGREAEALDAFRRFLDESTTLTDDAEIRDWRSTAVEHIAELEARIGSGEASAEGEDDASEHADETEADADVAQPTPSGGGGLSPVGPIVLGFGGVAAAVGAIFGGVVLAQDDELVAMCPDGRCPTAARTRADEIERLAITSNVLLISGAVIAATGLVLTLALREEAPSVSAACAPDGCAVQLGGRF